MLRTHVDACTLNYVKKKCGISDMEFPYIRLYTYIKILQLMLPGFQTEFFKQRYRLAQYSVYYEFLMHALTNIVDDTT